MTQKIFDPRKFLTKENFWPRKFLTQKNFWPKKNVNKFVSPPQKTFDLKFFLTLKLFHTQIFFSPKKYIGLKTFLWPNKSFKNSLTTNNFVQLALDWAWHSSVPTYFPLSCHVTRFISLPISYNQIYIRLPCSHGDRLQ